MFLQAMPWFGTIQFGYDDYSVKAVRKGNRHIAVPDRSEERPTGLHGGTRYLMEKHRSAVDRLAMQEDSRSVRTNPKNAGCHTYADLRVVVTLWDETLVFLLGYPMDALQFGARKSLVELYREAGIDVDLYRDEPGWKSTAGWATRAIAADIGRRSSRSIVTPISLSRIPSTRITHSIGLVHSCSIAGWRNGARRQASGRKLETPTSRPCPVMDGRPAEGIFRQNSEYLKDSFWWNSQSRITPGFQGGVHFLEPYAAAVADLDACRITRGGLFLDKAHSKQLRQFARAYRALPGQKFATVGPSTDPVAVRTLVQDGRRYIYAVNRDYYPVTVEMAFSGKPTDAEDLATGKRIALADVASFVLGPYELRSFAIRSEIEVGHFTATPPEKIVVELHNEAKLTLAAMTKVRAAGKSVPGMDEMEQRIRAALAAGKLAWLRRALASYIVRKCRATDAARQVG